MAEQDKGRRPKRRWRWWQVLLLAGASLLSLLILLLVLLLLLLPSRAFQERLQAEVLPKVSERLGREVSVRSSHVSLFPWPTLRVEGLRVAGATRAPLLEAEEGRAHLRLWPLIRSLGKEIELSSFTVLSPELNLLRKRDGSWDLPRLPKKAEGAPERELVVQEGRIRDGRVRLIREGHETLHLEGLQAAGSWEEEKLRLHTLRAQLYGGRLRADGSSIDLRGGLPTWSVLAALEGLHLDELPQKALRGKLSLDSDLHGAGSTTQEALGSLSGELQLALRQAEWRTLDLEGALFDRIAKELRRVGLPVHPRERKRWVELGDLKETLHLSQGWMRLDRAVVVRTSYGEAAIDGRIATDQRLDLQVRTELPPAVFDQLSGGKLKVDEDIPLRFHIGGTLEEPKVSDFDLRALLPKLAEGAIKEGLKGNLKVPKLPF